MPDEFNIQPNFGSTFRTFLHSQFLVTPPYPEHSFAGQTVIVTGSNVGLGLEAARHFYRLNCAKLVLAVRTVSKGQSAKEDIVRSVRHRTDADAIEVWPLDLTSTASTLAFAQKAKTELSRLDVVVENAGISNPTWHVHEGFEAVIQVNVINTLLLALSLLPKLTETKNRFPDSTPHLEIVSSEVHKFTKFPEANAPDLYQTLNDEASSNLYDRYNVSKLLEVLFIREFVSRLSHSQPSSQPPVVITLVNPGLCRSSLDRDQHFLVRMTTDVLRFIVGRATEVGSRTLVHGACAGPESHGMFMSDGKNQDVEPWIYTDQGKKVQKKVFEQTMKVLDERRFKGSKPDWGFDVGEY
ncbi:hypothetical protein, variant [Exophiala oligosperma]|uniref:Uncharacterized protein n=2 Tax=Chaetothyriales TaxID=34395 RepID=A0A0D2DZV7_9EURO|nr:uncharacterized protein PV06_06659 [Exophiala oligosperma]XP_016261280.1 hypothetical protein, variant [Exophiala oligosperma]KAJ9618363.1 hypothetical protein H2204_013094 [Knufia peltigerae]KIW41063.1 hypothetical protein PV06_06659 [Exophiala oligosperma]KIW41064.1 hypothetical protein, variant [Exophiala oligosperma]